MCIKTDDKLCQIDNLEGNNNTAIRSHMEKNVIDYWYMEFKLSNR